MHPYAGHTRSKNSVKLLGVNLDDTLTLEPHVDSVISSCYYHLRDIGKFKHNLSSDDLLTLTHSVISSKLDYCNVILFGLNSSLMDKLQKVQNAAARLICKLPRRRSVDNEIRKLHWLTVKQRCVYKILLTVFKRLNCTCPGFLSSLLVISDPETNSLEYTYYDSKQGDVPLGTQPQGFGMNFLWLWGKRSPQISSKGIWKHISLTTLEIYSKV